MSKKEQLLINAAQIIYEEGIQKLTMDYLAEKSNITKGGVLYHFNHKANLLFQMNKMAIEQLEMIMHKHMEKLHGPSRFTRAYALSTLDFLKNKEKALLPAVFISSQEDEQSEQLWQATLMKWESDFANDEGDESEQMALRLICDGIWFSMLYAGEITFIEKMEKVVLTYCEKLKGE